MPKTSQVLIIVTYEVAPGDHGSFEQILAEHAAGWRSYEGCLRFDVGRDVRKVNRYQLVELWNSQESLDAHSASESFKTALAALQKCDILSVRPDRYEIR